MPDEALTNAFAEFQAAQDDMERVDAQIVRLHENKAKIAERMGRARQFIIAWHEFAGKPAPTFGADAKVAPAVSHASGSAKAAAIGRAAANPKKETIAVAALQLVMERGSPIPRPELHELLKSRGLDVQGVDPLVTLSTMLWRAGPRAGLLHLKGFGYWDGTKPYEPAGYIPGNLIVEDIDPKRTDAFDDLADAPGSNADNRDDE